MASATVRYAMAEIKNLYQRLLAITDEVGVIEKTGSGQGLNYNFMEQAVIVTKLRPLLIKHGVMIMPEVVNKSIETREYEGWDNYKKANVKKTQRQAEVSMRFTVVNADDPKENMVCEWDAGEAVDSSDKATNKAVTAANKSFLMKLFNLSDKEDSDQERPEIATKPVVTSVPTAKAAAPAEPRKKTAEDIRTNVAGITDLEELVRYHKVLPESQQAVFKNVFSQRKAELERNKEPFEDKV